MCCELMELHLQWRGGRAALEALEVWVLRGEVTVSGLQGTTELRMHRDGWLRIELDLGVITLLETMRPTESWTRNTSGQIEPLAETQRLQHERALALAFLTEPEAYTSEEPVERDGRRWAVLRRDWGDGDCTDLLIDPSDGHLAYTREVRDGAEVWTALGDWREVCGVLQAFTVAEELADPPQKSVFSWQSAHSEPLVPEAFAPPASRRAATFPDSGSTGWIPADFHRGRHLFVAGAVNGRPADILIDSGASITVLGLELARALGLASQGQVAATGAGGSRAIDVVQDVHVDLGGFGLHVLSAAVADLSELDQKLGRAVHAILGREAFAAAVVQLDYEGERVALHDPERWTWDGEGVELPLLPGAGRKWVELTVEGRSAHFDLDTGAGSTTLYRAWCDEQGLLEGRRQSKTQTHGLGGAMEDLLVTLDHVEFAGCAMPPMPVNVHVGEYGGLATRRNAGNLGNDLFSRFELIFDYANERLIARQRADATTRPFRRNRVGAVPAMDGDALVLLYVSPGGPAEAAGLVVGDRVVRIDGAPIGADYHDEQYLWKFGEAGSRVALVLADGREVVLELADFY